MEPLMYYLYRDFLISISLGIIRGGSIATRAHVWGWRDGVYLPPASWVSGVAVEVCLEGRQPVDGQALYLGLLRLVGVANCEAHICWQIARIQL